MASQRRSRRRRGEKGYVLVMSAIIMIPLLAIGGMATDLGSWYAEGSRIQRAADAAALAGVVWLPDFNTAQTVAIATARANGFDDAAADITVEVVQLSDSELQVNITDAQADTYFSKFFISNVNIRRESIGQYVLPVPLGSPKNFFGTGGMAPSPNGPEGFWAAVNGWCAPKEQGDPFAPGFMGNWPSSGQVCPGSTVNPQFKAAPKWDYEYYVDLPATRTAPVQVSLYSPAKTNTSPDSNDSKPADTTFSLRAPDGTPFNDDDNPPYNSPTGSGTCSGGVAEPNPRTYVQNEVDNDTTIFGQSGWSRFCTIPASAPGGRYVLGVRTLAGQASSNTSNAYSIMASYNGNGIPCDNRTDASCPAVYGKDWISILAQASSPQADFYLAKIGPEHSGKQMEITLFDPGEGGNSISIRDPLGNPVSFDYHTQDGLYSGTGLTALDVSGCSGQPQIGPDRGSQCKFNERFVVISIDLPANYGTVFAANYWWKIHYDFSSNVTDRSTWSVRILGDPVHLVN